MKCGLRRPDLVLLSILNCWVCSTGRIRSRMNALRDTVARNLRRLRTGKGWTQEEFAFRAKVDRSYVSQLETGVYSASVTMLGKLSKALGVDPSEFLKP